VMEAMDGGERAAYNAVYDRDCPDHYTNYLPDALSKSRREKALGEPTPTRHTPLKI
jgi:hypothetical protein